MNTITEIIHIVNKIGFKPIPLNEENNLYHMTNKDVNSNLLSIYLFINEQTNRISFTCPFPYHITEGNFDKSINYINELNLTLAKGNFVLRTTKNDIVYNVRLSYKNFSLNAHLINNLLWTCFDNVERYHLGLLGYLEKDFTLKKALRIEYNRHLNR